MKRKELKNLAQKIADCEYVIEHSKDEKQVNLAQIQIMNLTSRVHDFQDMDIIDEMVQELLKKMS